MNIVFRVDSSDYIGIGHLKRCVNLAKILSENDNSIHFIGVELSGHSMDIISEAEFKVTSIKLSEFKPVSSCIEQNYYQWFDKNFEKDAYATLKSIVDEKVDWLVIDHYGIDQRWESMLLDKVANIMVIDDIPGKNHVCNVLLDSGCLSSNKTNYDGHVPETCKLLLGRDYILLGDEYRSFNDSSIKKTDKYNVLVFFTAGDDDGETLKAMEALSQYDAVGNVNIVVGSGNKYINEIKDICDKYSWLFHCQINYMHKLIAESDIAIGSCGSNSWERCAMNLPAIVAIMDENQKNILNVLNDNNAVICVGPHKATTSSIYHSALKKINNKKLSKMKQDMSGIVDGMGVERVMDVLSHQSDQIN